MDPRTFHLLAKTLVSGPDTDPARGIGSKPDAACCRTAVNRAYYAAYNVGVEVLEQWGIAIERTAKGHGQVRGCLQNTGDRDLQKAARWLNDLYGDRERADYRLDDGSAETASVANKAIRVAEQVIETLDRVAVKNVEEREPLIRSIQRWQNAPRRTY